MNNNQHNQSVVSLTNSISSSIRSTAKRNVLICEPQLCSYLLPYLPAMWGVLKTYWETHAHSAEMIHWHDPVYKMDPPEQIIESIKDLQIDVLGLSCYTWNWRLQREIAQRIKEARPQCLIIAGGPHPDYRDPSFFDDNPFIDAVVVKNGEVPFNQILERVLSFSEMLDLFDADEPLADIPGLVLPGRGGKLTAPVESPADFDTSAYLAQRPYYEQFLRDHPQGVVAAWETSRGCPFRCSYCDWGSSTMSKVRKFDMGRLKEEIDWFARSGVCVIFSVDSNFGMFKTDVEITDAIVDAKANHGHPSYFIYSNAKNVPARTVEITRKVVGAGLETAHTLSIQHSSLDVLEATDRENISIEKQIDVVRALQADGLPISVQLILGLPKDTPHLWRTTFTDLMEWGIHDGHTVTNYHLLPNAPAADPVYREQWQIKGIERYIYDGPGWREDIPVDPLTYPRGEVIISTSSFSCDDWVTMSTESSVLRGLHNTGLTQSIARYLRSTHDISYHAFYSDLLDSFLPSLSLTNPMLKTLKDCFNQFIVDDSFLAMLPIPGGLDSDLIVEPHRWFFASICRDVDQFYDALIVHLKALYPSIAQIESICHYQRHILVLPRFIPNSETTVELDHDWPSYFANPDTLIAGDLLPDAVATPNGIMSIEDTGWNDGTGSGEYDWEPGETHASWIRWFYSMASNRLSATKCNHQILRVLEQV